MARITVEDCLETESNRFTLVRLASLRAKELLAGDPPVTDTKGNKSVVSALREIAAGKVTIKLPEGEDSTLLSTLELSKLENSDDSTESSELLEPTTSDSNDEE